MTLYETMLYHFTCEHAFVWIDGLLIPQQQLLLDSVDLVWLTDLQDPDPLEVGLTSNILDCDRTEVRLRVIDDTAVRRWVGSVEHSNMSPELQAVFHHSGAQQQNWYISSEPVKVVLDGRRNDDG